MIVPSITVPNSTTVNEGADFVEICVHLDKPIEMHFDLSITTVDGSASGDFITFSTL